MLRSTVAHYSSTRYFILLLALFVTPEVDSSSPEYRQTIERVRIYLHRNVVKGRMETDTSTKTNWLENSNKIGLGYHLLSGSPVCYTGACQMAGFMQPVFKLNYLSPATGSCTSKLVPDHIQLDCLPSTSLKVDSETISTVEQLKKSISNTIEMSISARYIVAAFSYSFLKETRYMIDNIVKRDTTSIVSRAML